MKASLPAKGRRIISTRGQAYRTTLRFIPDNPLGTIQCDFIVSVRPELVEGLVLTGLVVRRAHHERPNGLSGFIQLKM